MCQKYNYSFKFREDVQTGTRYTTLMLSTLRQTNDHRSTRIIATLGPATESEKMLENFIRGGVDVFRLNMAHASHDWVKMIVRRIRDISSRVGREVAVMMDIKGPEIRTGDLSEPMQLEAGDLIDFTVEGAETAAGLMEEAPDGREVRSVGVNYRDIVHDVRVGDTVVVDNGLLEMKVLARDAGRLRCKVLIGGILKSRRHINLPGVHIKLPSFTEKDARDTLVGIEAEVDYFALSFVREAADIHVLREFLCKNKSRARIIAKIEDMTAITNIRDIVISSDAVMVARGDLGIEVPFENLPVIQRHIVNTCLGNGRPVIIATHMLESMIKAPLPTRAEVTDVANAIYEHADAIMLSGETTVGAYPLECLRVMDKIARRIEVTDAGVPVTLHNVPDERLKLLRSAVGMSGDIQGSVLVTFTHHGTLAAGLAALRPRARILALTDHMHVLRQMRLLYGVEPFLMTFDADPDKTINDAIALLLQENAIRRGEKLVIATDVLSRGTLVNSIQLRVAA